jgi:hypothetical protein
MFLRSIKFFLKILLNSFVIFLRSINFSYYKFETSKINLNKFDNKKFVYDFVHINM